MDNLSISSNKADEFALFGEETRLQEGSFQKQHFSISSRLLLKPRPFLRRWFTGWSRGGGLSGWLPFVLFHSFCWSFRFLFYFNCKTAKYTHKKTPHTCIQSIYFIYTFQNQMLVLLKDLNKIKQNILPGIGFSPGLG